VTPKSSSEPGRVEPDAYIDQDHEGSLLTSIHPVRIPNCGGSEKKDDLKNVSGTVDSTAARNGMERQGLRCRLYVSNNQSPCTMRYNVTGLCPKGGEEKQCDQSTQFNSKELFNGKGSKMCPSGRKQPECGQPGYAVVCYTSHLPYTTRYILPDYVREGRTKIVRPDKHSFNSMA
jgi:hypothetical protein